MKISVAFDWDETLLDSRKQFEVACRESHAKYGTVSAFNEFQHLTRHKGLFKYTRELILSIKQPIHIISNKDESMLLRELRDTGVLYYLNGGVVRGDAGKPLRSYNIYKEIEKRDGTQTGLMIGDNMCTDLPAALNAGWEYIHLNGRFSDWEIEKRIKAILLYLGEK